MKAKIVWEEKNIEHGEGVIFDNKNNVVLWVDILGKKLFRYDFNNEKHNSWNMPEYIGCVVLTQIKDEVLVLLKNSIKKFNLSSNTFSDLVTFTEEPENNRFNDGFVDTHGRFWVGSMDFKGEESTGVLYCVNKDLTYEIKDSGYNVVNGPTISHDNKTLYVNETKSGKIFSFNYNLDNGNIGNKKLFKKFKKNEGLPDGLTVDTEGGVWVAAVLAGCVRRFSSDGKLDQEIKIPSPIVTSCKFGGLNNSTLYVTTSKILMDNNTLKNNPLSGSLFSVETSFQGLKSNRFFI
jgi:sugar lactone lactonase YvrE